MKQGLTLEGLAELLDFQQEHKRDFVVDTAVMTLRQGPQPNSPFVLNWVDTSQRRPRKFSYPMTHYMLTQIASHTNVSMGLIDRMRDGTEIERTEIAKLITIRLNENPSNRLIRTMAGKTDADSHARAMLSDRYRTLDNYDLLQAVFPVIQKYSRELKFVSCDATESRMYIKLRCPLLNAKLGTANKQGREVDDIVEAGVIISNSEVGAGPVKVQLFLYRLVCRNGAVGVAFTKGQRKIHIGRQLGPNDSPGDIDNTKIFEAVADNVKGLLKDKKMFKRMAEQFREAKGRKFKDADAAVRMVGKLYRLNEDEVDLITDHLKASRESTQFALINAVTSASQSKGITYDRASELEEIGGKLIDTGDKAWKKIGNARPKVADIFD